MSEILGLIVGVVGLISSCRALFDRGPSAIRLWKDSAIDYTHQSPLLSHFPAGLDSLSDKVKHHLQRIHNNFSLAVEDDPGSLKTHLPTLGTIGHIWRTGLRISQQLLNGKMPQELTHLWGMLRFVLSRQAIYAAEHESEELQDVLISLEMSNTMPADDWNRWRNVLSPVDRPLFDEALRLLLGPGSEDMLDDSKSCRSSHEYCDNAFLSEALACGPQAPSISKSSAEGEQAGSTLRYEYDQPLSAYEFDINSFNGHLTADVPLFHDFSSFDLHFEGEDYWPAGVQCQLPITSSESPGNMNSSLSEDDISRKVTGLVSTAVFGVVLIILIFIDKPNVVTQVVDTYWTNWVNHGGCHTPSAFITVMLCLAIDVSPRPSPCTANVAVYTEDDEMTDPSGQHVHDHESANFPSSLSTESFPVHATSNSSLDDDGTPSAPSHMMPYINPVQDILNGHAHNSSTDEVDLFGNGYAADPVMFGSLAGDESTRDTEASGNSIKGPEASVNASPTHVVGICGPDTPTSHTFVNTFMPKGPVVSSSFAPSSIREPTPTTRLPIQPCPRCNKSDFSTTFNRNKHVHRGTNMCPSGGESTTIYCKHRLQGCLFKYTHPSQVERHEEKCKVGEGGKPRRQRKAAVRADRG